MDSRIVSGLIVGELEPYVAQDSPLGPGFVLSKPDQETNLHGRVNSLLSLRSLPALERFLENFRSKFGAEAKLDYEVLVDSDVLRRFMDGVEHDPGRDIESAYIRAILNAISGPTCSVPFLPLTRLVNDSFIDLDLYSSRTYILKVMIAASDLVQGVGDHVVECVDIPEMAVASFIECYYKELVGLPQLSWPDRVLNALMAAMPLFEAEQAADPSPKSLVSAFTLGFSSPIREPFMNSMFAAQVRQGLAMVTQI